MEGATKSGLLCSEQIIKWSLDQDGAGAGAGVGASTSSKKQDVVSA
jgi:hypothetical protein